MTTPRRSSVLALALLATFTTSVRAADTPALAGPITIHPTSSAVKRLVRLVPWHGSQEDLDYLILSEENDPLEAP